MESSWNMTLFKEVPYSECQLVQLCNGNHAVSARSFLGRKTLGMAKQPGAAVALPITL